MRPPRPNGRSDHREDSQPEDGLRFFLDFGEKVRQHPDLGLVSPAKFIPILEDTGDIVEVGEWVLHTACYQGKAWQDSGLAPLRVAVNLSARQFVEEDLVFTVARVIQETGLNPRFLELEITESLLMKDIEAISRTLNELKTTVRGIRVSIDDFGTGYSSLYYLKTFPIEVLKIDRSFVRDITTDPHTAEITATIIRLAHKLSLEVIAEGVETEEQLARLREWGCGLAQGFYLGRPLPAEDFAELVKKKAYGSVHER
jgi:EAL domain-containing protein (putative c-di-GMP-specific phosphodiesterase class I)